MNDSEYMEIAYQQAIEAFNADEIPIGAILIKDDNIISYGYNKRQTLNKITRHAEIIAIEDASSKLNTWKLDKCTLYVTLEPCMMCTGAIIQSKISRVVFGAYENKEIALSKILFQTNDKQILHHPNFTGGILEEKCSNIIKQYFKNKRKQIYIQ